MNNQNELGVQKDSQKLSKFEETLMQGDLKNLSPAERVSYYKNVCESLGLNPLTKPFEYITLNTKLTLYATRSCTDQLRSLNKVSVRITERQKADGLYIVTAQAFDASGRIDDSVGAVKIEGLAGEALANALMKAETKAKRRATLSFCGLGFLDESEVESTVNSPFQNTKANIAQAVRPEIKNTEQRQNLVFKLQSIMEESGIEALSKEWKEKLSPEERKLVGAEEIQRIKKLPVSESLGEI